MIFARIEQMGTALQLGRIGRHVAARLSYRLRAVLPALLYGTRLWDRGQPRIVRGILAGARLMRRQQCKGLDPSVSCSVGCWFQLGHSVRTLTSELVCCAGGEVDYAAPAVQFGDLRCGLVLEFGGLAVRWRRFTVLAMRLLPSMPPAMRAQRRAGRSVPSPTR